MSAPKRKLIKVNPNDVELDGDWPNDRELANSMASQGQLHPIHITENPEGFDLPYCIVAGRGRVMAGRFLGWGKELEAYVYPDASTAIACVALAENLRRDNPLSDARNLVAGGLTAEEAYQVAGMNKAQYDRAMNLARLCQPLQERMERGHLPKSVAYRLARLDQSDQVRAMNWADQENMKGKARAKGPTTGQYLAGIREVKASRSRAMPIAIPDAVTVTRADSLPDPIVVAGALRRLMPAYPGSMSQKAFETAIAILEGQGRR